MPVLTSNPVPSQPVMYDNNPLTRVGELASGALQGLAGAYAAPYVAAARQWGVVKPRLVEIKEVGEPYSGFKDLTKYSALSVCGQPLPAGIVMTHCRVSERVDYRGRPLQDVVASQYALRETYRTTFKDGKQSSYLAIKASKTTDAQLAAAKLAQKAQAAVDADIKAGKKVRVSDVSAQLTSADTSEELKAIGTKEGIERLRRKMGKVYIGDFLPRTAELRFILHDAIAIQSFGGPGKLVFDRYDLLDRVHAFFCKNPNLQAEYRANEATVVSEAALITQANTAGHLVRLESMGLNPYKVDIWLVSEFTHMEVPDSDLIAVKMTLVEYESPYSSIMPEQAPVPGTTTEQKYDRIDRPVRPSYQQEEGLA